MGQLLLQSSVCFLCPRHLADSHSTAVLEQGYGQDGFRGPGVWEHSLHRNTGIQTGYRCPKETEAYSKGSLTERECELNGSSQGCSSIQGPSQWGSVTVSRPQWSACVCVPACLCAMLKLYPMRTLKECHQHPSSKRDAQQVCVLGQEALHLPHYRPALGSPGSPLRSSCLLSGPSMTESDHARGQGVLGDVPYESQTPRTQLARKSLCKPEAVCGA